MLSRLVSQAFKPHLMATQARRAISVQSILHGSPEAIQEGDVTTQQHSKLVGRGKYVHGFEVHKVKPDAVEAYKKAAEEYYTAIKDDPELRVKLSGSWETIVGEQDTFFHILEYENYSGYDSTSKKIRNSDHIKAYKKMIPYLTSRTSQLCQEFALFPTAPPRSEGGIFELRTYQLKPGSLLQWESTCRYIAGEEVSRLAGSLLNLLARGIRRLVDCTRSTTCGNIRTCTRKERREKAWQLDGWSETVTKTAEYSILMDSIILESLPFSSLK
ncbi:Protein NipSnap 2 [Grifola frondosa]|uniref:Protein NipSnap 2 n=1 Tax=Grifola frondosa TaxID=5627 RepID=A0A1C7MVL9_GRIFR|nr:Protein NipSnap 2 [Grifola frondosa]